MSSKADLKRKAPYSSGHASLQTRDPKRAKLQDARTILAQSSEKALNSKGELDVGSFVKAREFEIQALERNMVSSKHGLTQRAFQQVPRELRRRTASHNVKKVPKRLRNRAAREMREDNTPTVNSRTRKLTGKQRLREDVAKKVQRRQAEKEKLQESKEVSKSMPDGELQDPVKDALSEGLLNPPNGKNDTLAEPPKAESKFRKRQVHKAWLPTHVFHAKRAHMTPPSEPLWRFAIPLSPTEKVYRSTHRASAMRGCVAWDMSYMSTIMLKGSEKSLLSLLRAMGVSEEYLSAKQGEKWRLGTRSWKTWLRERDSVNTWIAEVLAIWCCSRGPSEDTGKDDGQAGTASRELLLRAHPAAFLQLWDEVLKVAKMQRPKVSVEDLRFEVGSIEIEGPGATEALVRILKSAKKDQETVSSSTGTIWQRLAQVTDPAVLPSGSIISLLVTDPRLHHPPHTVDMDSTSPDELLEILSSWPPDQVLIPQSLFSRAVRYVSCQVQPSQKAINRRKSLAPPGENSTSQSRDPEIPILLCATRSSASPSRHGSWMVLLPWNWVLPVWYSLMYYSLSTGGTPRFGGLDEKRQIAFEHGTGWFPADFPGTKAGWDWEMKERERRRVQWEKRPKGKRVSWDAVDLGIGRRGEIGVGWACDWELLFGGKSSPESETNKEAESPMNDQFGPDEATQTQQSPGVQENPQTTSILPYDIHHVFWTQLTDPASAHVQNTLLTVRIELLQRGVPTTCARIYRLPSTSTNAKLRTQWLALLDKDQQKELRTSKLAWPARSLLVASGGEKQAASAKELLDGPAVAGGGRAYMWQYPVVPDLEDLIGFVTTGNFNLGEGKGTGIGCVAVQKLCQDKDHLNKFQGGSKDGRSAYKSGLCIVREAGGTTGRLAKWNAI